MIVRMFSRLFPVLALIVTLTTSAFSQQTNATVSRDVRLFTAMAALNAAGFDVEFGSQYHPVREKVRQYAVGVDPDLIARLKVFYRQQKANETDEAQLAKYISLAVNLGDPPDFKLALREESLPPDARAVAEFADLMREYYDKAHLGRHWLELRADYDREVARVGPTLRDVIVRTDAYMRSPLGANSFRGLSIYIELAAPVNTVNVRSNQDSYYVIIGDSSHLRVDDIRHAYLHFQLDSLVTKYFNRMQSVSTLLDRAKKAQGVDPAYTSEFRIMVTESLIRALELRMDKAPAARARESMDTFYRSGLLLTPYFYGALESYEKAGVALRDAFGDMARNVKYVTEETRFDQTFAKIPLPQKSVARPEVPQPEPAPPPPDPKRDILKQAEAAFKAGDLAKAQASFERVLSDFDHNDGAAEYGLALIASKNGDSDEAKKQFDRVLQNASVEPQMKVWAYIYRGRIFDLECERERAVEYYQQAVKVGDDSQNAQANARQGLQKPYGGGDSCR
jgi:tetratricopeptide (TPR) repeat protein